MANTLPPNTLIPGTIADVTIVSGNLAPVNDQVLLIGQMSMSGVATDGQIVPVFTEADAILYAGGGSPLHLAARSAFEANPSVNLSLLCIADSTSYSKTSWTLAVTSAPTTQQIFNIYIDDTIIPINIPANFGTTGNVASYICSQIGQYVPELPIIADVGGSSIDISSVVSGTIGNYIRVATDPITTPFFTLTKVTATGVFGLGTYTTPGTYAATIATCSHSVLVNVLGDSTSVNTINTILNFRSGPTEQNYGMQFVAYNDLQYATPALAVTFAQSVNSPRLSIGYIQYVTGTIPKSSATALSGAYGAMIPIRSNITVNVPYTNMAMTGIVPCAVNDEFTGSAEQYLIAGGVTPFNVQPGQQVVIIKACTTNTLTSAGNLNYDLLNVGTQRQIDYISTQLTAGVENNFSNSVANDRTLASICSNLFNTTVILEANNLLQNTGNYRSGIIAVYDNINIGQVDVTIPIQLVNGLFVTLLNIQVNI